MRAQGGTTFRRYISSLEISVLALTSAILLAAVWLTLSEMNRKYLDLRLADAAKVHLFLEGHLDAARESLTMFASLPEAERAPTVMRLMSDFSDIYLLDNALRIERIYKSAPGSKVFPGYVFSGGRLAAYVKSVRGGSDFSEIMRGHEDDAPSVYFAIRPAGQLYLGRLNLAYVQSFLTQFSRFSGTPTMLVAQDGFVMLSGDPELHIPAFDLKRWEGTPTPRRTLAAADRRWIPMILKTNTIGAKIAILIPTELLDTQRNALLVFLLAFLGVLTLLIVVKNRQLNRLIMQPMAAFAEKMRNLESGQPLSADDAVNYRFQELADIHTRFRAMAQAIAQREQSLAETTMQAQAASLAKSEFLANMSHEIRTPLNAILGFAQVLGRDLGLNVAQRDSLTTIERSGEHLLTLVDDVLDMAKIEAGRMTSRVAPFDLQRLVAETDAFFRPRVGDRGLVLTVEASLRCPTVVGDELRLRQVLINLVGNAIKFTPEGSVRIRVASLAGDAIRFGIVDTGMGIAPDEMDGLFQPFTQTASGRQVQGGTGLGLALCSRLVRLMGGELTAESLPGQGSCFSFTLALPPADAVAPIADSAQPPIVALEPDQPVCRVLIVDDLADNRAPLRALLESLNPQPPVIAIREAADGRAAVALWEAWQPHVVFMDIRMPVMSGEEATRRIKSLMAERPAAVRSVIVALTASAFDDNRAHFLACGCDDFARKPFRAKELLAILERRTSLRFVRSGELPTPQPTLSFDEAAARLAACSDDWRAELHGAVSLGDFDRIGALLEQLRDGDAALYEALAKWAYDYDLDAFSRILAVGG